MKTELNKKILFIALLLSFSAIFIGCSKDDDNGNESEGIVTNAPGAIPGLGETSGSPTGKPFKLPDGVSLVGNINGAFDNSSRSSAIESKDKENIEVSTLRSSTQALADNLTMGSGFSVTLNFNLKNDNSSSREVVFPAGLILIATSKEYQNGVLLKKASISIPGNQTVPVTLVMYCGNLEREGSFISAQFSFGVVSNSSLIMKLCDKLTNKKINTEEFGMATWMSNSTYMQQAIAIQVILHNLTDRGIDLREEDIHYLDNLPNSN